MSETIVRCPMCPNHCDVRMLRCIRGRQWQMRQRNRAANNMAQRPAEKEIIEKKSTEESK